MSSNEKITESRLSPGFQPTRDTGGGEDERTKSLLGFQTASSLLPQADQGYHRTKGTPDNPDDHGSDGGSTPCYDESADDVDKSYVTGSGISVVVKETGNQSTASVKPVSETDKSVSDVKKDTAEVGEETDTKQDGVLSDFEYDDDDEEGGGRKQGPASIQKVWDVLFKGNNSTTKADGDGVKGKPAMKYFFEQNGYVLLYFTFLFSHLFVSLANKKVKLNSYLKTVMNPLYPYSIPN